MLLLLGWYCLAPQSTQSWLVGRGNTDMPHVRLNNDSESNPGTFAPGDDKPKITRAVDFHCAMHATSARDVKGLQDQACVDVRMRAW